MDWEHYSIDRKSTRLNSSHLVISYAVFCLKKKNKNTHFNGVSHHRALASHVHSCVTCVYRLSRTHRITVYECDAVCPTSLFFFFFFNDTAPPEIYPLSLHNALPICSWSRANASPISEEAGCIRRPF